MTSPDLLSPELEAMIEEALPCEHHPVSGTTCDTMVCFPNLGCSCENCPRRPAIRILVRSVVERCERECDIEAVSENSVRAAGQRIRALAQPKETKP